MMDRPGDVVSDLQHSLMNAHGLLKKMKAIARQLNASHTLLLMKQSTSNEQLTEYVQDIRMKLEHFHDNMVHQLTDSFQEKTVYLDTCLRQLQCEEKTIDQLCKETEVLLKQVTRNISPMQVQKARTLLQAFKMLTKENSADLELEEDVICLDFVPCKSVDELSSFGSIRVSRDSSIPKQISIGKSGNKTTASRSCQTEILFKDYCPFCGRTYSKGKKDAEVQSSLNCSECESLSWKVRKGNENLYSDTAFVGKSSLKSELYGQKLAMDQEPKHLETRRKELQAFKGGYDVPNVTYVRNVLNQTGLGKKGFSDESSSSYPEEASSPFREEREVTFLQTRKRCTLTGKQLKNLNKQSLEDIWHSSDDEMEEITARLSNPLTFAAAVKHKDSGDWKGLSQSKESHPSKYVSADQHISGSPVDGSAGDSATLNYIPPPKTGAADVHVEPLGNVLPQQEKSVVKPKKRTLAAKSLNMLTGLINTAKAENVINPPYIRKKDTDDCDWWGDVDSPKVKSEVHVVHAVESPQPKLKSEVHVVCAVESPQPKLKSEVHVVHAVETPQPKLKSEVHVVSSIKSTRQDLGSDASSGGVPECWLDEADSTASNSVTSTPRAKRKNRTNSKTNVVAFPQEEEEFRLRRPSFSFKMKSLSLKEENVGNLDANNNKAVSDENLEEITVEAFEQLHISPPVKSEKIETETILMPCAIKKEPFSPEQDSNYGVVDSGWEEDSTVWENKDTFKSDNKDTKRVKDMKITYTESWTKNVTVGVSAAIQGTKVFLSKADKNQLNGSENLDEDRKPVLNSVSISAQDGFQSDGQHIEAMDIKGDEIKIKHRRVSRWDQLPTSDPDQKQNQAKNETRASRWDQLPTSDPDQKQNQAKNETRASRWDQLAPSGSDCMNESRNKSEVAGMKYRISRWDIPPHSLQNVNMGSLLSPVAKYIAMVSKVNSRMVLPPIPAKLIGKIGGKDYGLHFPIGVATSSYGDIAVADTGNHLIKIFTSDGKHRSTIGSKLKPAMQRPSAIVINERDDMFVKDDQCIRMFDIVQGVMIRQMGAYQLSMPYGLCLTKDGNLLTLDVDKRNPKIVIFSQKGELMNFFPYSPLQGRVPQSKCRFLGVNQNNLVVSDLGRHEIYVTDLQGKLKFTFGRGGYGNGEFYEPSGIEVDSSGNMIIADSKNDRIQIFHPDGSFACNIAFSEYIKRPSDIHLTKDGKLIVVNFLTHQLKIYKLGDDG